MTRRHSCAGDKGLETGLGILVGMLAVLLACQAHAGPRYRWEAGTSLSYSSGDYGEPDDTDMVYIPVVIKRFFDAGELSLVVPWLYVETGAEQVIVDGRPQGGDAESSGGRDSSSGLGDILLKGRYYVVTQDGAKPYVDLLAKVKLPTADEGDGLGTGEADFGIGVDVSRWFAGHWFAFFEADYVFIGDPPDVDYDNRTLVDLGLGRQVNRHLQASAFYEYRSSIDPDDADSQSLLASASYRLTPQTKVYGVVEGGLSDGAPDYSVTFGVSHRY
ncbi:MAG: transporter [Verrucomicrobiota bacterium]